MVETLLTAKDVAKRLNVSKAWVLSHANGRRHPVLPSVKMGRSVRFREKSVEQFIQRCERLMAQGLPLQ